MKRRDVNPGAETLDGCFGFDPAEASAHFLLHIPASAQVPVEISEHLSWDPERVGPSIHYNADRVDGQVRSRLARAKWNEIADVVRAEFNMRLKSQGRRPGRWKVGFNPLARAVGKELCLLMWAIEDADPNLISTAIANWQGLMPEERWWLYTMTAAATGNYVTGRNAGWRRAVRYALTENPVSHRPPEERVVPEFFRLAEALPSLVQARTARQNVEPRRRDTNEGPRLFATEKVSPSLKRRPRRRSQP